MVTEGPMGEVSKRDEARAAFQRWIAIAHGSSSDDAWYHYTAEEIRSVVDLIVDAAKEEIRAELAEQAEEGRWQEMRRSMALCYVSPAFHEEYRALKAKREAAGKSTD